MTRLIKTLATVGLLITLVLPLQGCIPFVAGMIAYQMMQPTKPKTTTTCVTPPGATQPQCTTATTS